MNYQLINLVLNIPTAFAQTTGGIGQNVSDISNGTQDQIGSLVSYIIHQIPLWITALLVIGLSFIVAKIVKNSVEAKLSQNGMEEEHKEIQIVATRTAHASVLIIGITIGLKIAGLDLTPIIAAGAFGIGFALQDLIMNFLAGVMILASHHYTIGDTITVDGSVGKIIEIQTRATIIKAFDGTKVIVPNATLFKNTVISKTSNPFRKIKLQMGVAYGTDLKKVMDLTLETVKGVKGVLAEPKPSVVFTEWGDSSINFNINSWIESKGTSLTKVKNRLMIAITAAYEKAGIEIPYPIQTLYINQQASTPPTVVSQNDALPIQQIEQTPVTVVPTTPTEAISPVVETVINPTPIIITPEPTPAPAPIPTIVQTPVMTENPVQAQIPQPTPAIAEAPAPVQVVAPEPVPSQTQPLDPKLSINPLQTINSDAPDWLKDALSQQMSSVNQPTPDQKTA